MKHATGKITHAPGDGLYDEKGHRLAVLSYSPRGVSARLPGEETSANGDRLALAWNTHDDLIDMVRLLMAAIETPGDLCDHDRHHLLTDAHDLLIDVGAEPEQDDTCRQTACVHCGQDIEGLSPFPAGEWRDRGNNTTCPTPEGDAGQHHEPVKGGA